MPAPWKIAALDPQSDGLLVILAPQGMTDPARVAESLKPYAKGTGKPILASWMGGKLTAGGEGILNSAGIPTFAYPDTAARAFDYMWRYSENLRALYQTPILTEELEDPAGSRAAVGEILERVRGGNRTLLTEYESKQVLTRYGIPTVETRVARTEEEAVKFARELGFPAVLKVHSETITHKTDVGGVKLSLGDEESVCQAYRAIATSVKEKASAGQFLGVTVQPMVKFEGYELILGSSVDPQFGPVLLFGSGGQLVEVYRDRALGLPPLNATLASRLMERTRIYQALKGVRGRAPVNLEQLQKLLVRFSHLVVDQPWIREIDINPLLASPAGLLALDARIVLYDPKTPREKLTRPAIRPYPTQYTGQWSMKDGTPLKIRPIRPEDEPAMVKFHEGLSNQSVYLRFFAAEKLSTRIAHERLVRSCFIDYRRELALVAERQAAQPAEAEIIAVGRMVKSREDNSAEIAIVVSDRYQKQGLGTELVRRLVEVGRAEKLGRLVANFLAQNRFMRRVLEGLGFHIASGTAGMLVAVLEL